MDNPRFPDIHKEKEYSFFPDALSTLLKDIKQQYFTDFLKSNNNDIKKTWKGIKSIIFMKNKSNNGLPTLIIYKIDFIVHYSFYCQCLQ